MPNFVVREIMSLEGGVFVPTFKTRQRVSKLIRNGRCVYDEFVERIKADNNLEPELDEMVAFIEDVGNGKMLSKNRYKKLPLGKLKYAGWEVKTAHLRLYLIHVKETGMILILGGKKTEQDENISALVRIIKEYSNS